MKPLCSVCHTVLNEEKDGKAICGYCGAVYYPSKEIIEYKEEDFTSSHADEYPEVTGTGGGSAGIMMAGDEQDGPLIDQLYKDLRKKPKMGEFAESWD
jgi:hypothetical protein